MKDKKIYRVLIAEDEYPARELLVDFILSFPALKLAGIARNGEEAMEKLNSEEFDIVLLDINLPMLSGIDVLERLSHRPRIIFTTAYESYAVKAFEFGADDYLVKPFTRKRFAVAVEKCLSALRSPDMAESEPDSGGNILAVKEKDAHHLIQFDDIIFITSNGRKCIINTQERDYETYLPLSSVLERLPADSFIRIHKQYVVNLKYVSHFSYYSGGQYILYLRNDDKNNLPVGRIYAPLLKQRIDVK
jgi:DNA-binding LytR/AlgR family response regulator